MVPSVVVVWTESDHFVIAEPARAGEPEPDELGCVSAVVMIEVTANVVKYVGGVASAHAEADDGWAIAPACDWGFGPDVVVALLDCKGTAELTTGWT